MFPGPTHSIEWGCGVSGGVGPDTHDLGGAASQTDGALGRTQGAHPSSRFASWRAACTGAAGVLGLPLARPSQRHSGDVPFRPFPPAPFPRRPDPSAMPKQSAAKQRRAPQPRARLYERVGSRRGGVSRGRARTRTRARTATTGRSPTRPPATSPAHGASRTTCPPGRSRAAVCAPSASPLAGVQPGRRQAGERLRSGASSAVTRAPTCRGGAWVQSRWVMGPFRTVPRDPGVGCVGPPPRPGP